VRELFVWYRVRAAAAAEAKAAVLRMQQDLATRHAGLSARLLVRRGEPDAAETWMETYRCDGSPAGVDGALERSIASAAEAFAALLDGPRHAEAFEPSQG
jgi:hypothetical protein